MRNHGLLTCGPSVPEAFDDSALLFALAYGAVRIAHLVLFGVASRDDPALRHSVLIGLTGSTVVAVGLLVAASFADGVLQGALWAIALTLACPGRCSSAPRAGSWSPATSLSATA